MTFFCNIRSMAGRIACFSLLFLCLSDTVRYGYAFDEGSIPAAEAAEVTQPDIQISGSGYAYHQRTFFRNSGGHLVSNNIDNKSASVSMTSAGPSKKYIDVLNKGYLTASAFNEEKLPSSFDPRGTGMELPIRDQEDSGACWAFASMRTLELTACKAGIIPVSKADFSENHLSWYTYNDYTENETDDVYGDSIRLLTRKESTGSSRSILSENEISDKTAAYMIGGTADMAVGILAAGTGAVYEDTAPFSDVSTMAEAMMDKPYSFRNQSDIRLVESNGYGKDDLDGIKEQIIECGAVEMSMYYMKSSLKKDADGSYSYYQRNHDEDDANHSVTAVGYDDSYNRFSGSVVPADPGAWLIANSYGENENEKGYFWLSYYDSSITEIASFSGVHSDDYSTCYQYDATGWNGTISGNGSIYQANVFTNSGKEQYVTDVSFYTFADGQEYEINIYKNPGEDSPETGEHIYSSDTSGTEKYRGYHTVKLKKPVHLYPGERFAVIVKFLYNNKVVEIGVEGESVDNYLSRKKESNYMTCEVMQCNYGSREGESFYYTEENGSWHDTSKDGYNNVCVKAFAKDVNGDWTAEPAETPIIEPTGAPTVKPTEKPVTWSAGASTAEPALGQTTAPTSAPVIISTTVPITAPTVEPANSLVVAKNTTATKKPSAATGRIQAKKKKINTLAMNAGFRVSQHGSEIKIKWGTLKDADCYDVYAAYCGTSFSKIPVKTTAKNAVRVKKINGRRIDLAKKFKVYVVAKSKKKKLAKTMVGHIVGKKNKKYTNARYIKLSSRMSVAKRKTVRIKAKTILINRGKKQLTDSHAKEFRYASADAAIAKVAADGTVTGVKAGSCIIYVYSRNGYAKKVKVTVK